MPPAPHHTTRDRMRPSPPGLPVRARCLVMGVLNVTPDSFSDGGSFQNADQAVAYGLDLARQGADILDVGGESTRPGASRVGADEELRRVLPVVRGLAEAGLSVSVDTMRARVAEQALDAGAVLVNDVSGGLADPAMVPLVAERAVPYVLMHWRGQSERMYQRSQYTDVVTEVRDELLARVDAVLAAGLPADRLVLDPGLGFAKRSEQNWPLLRGLPALVEAGFPVLVGASRKSFLSHLLADPDTGPRPFTECDDATTAITALAAQAGAWGVRVHRVRPSVDAALTAARWGNG